MILKSLVDSYLANIDINKEKTDELGSSIANAINSGDFKILDVIINLKNEFISEDEKKRQQSLHCLSNILNNLSSATLKKNELNVIFNFYQSKIDELNNMTEILSGFNSLTTMDSVSMLEISTLLNIISNEYEPSKFLTPTRYQTFLILSNIIEKYKIEMKEDPKFLELFVSTFLHIANGEKDPRNLLLSFKINKTITTNFKNIEQFAEDLFDVLFCYFPITFRPPKDDPYKITAEDLKSALQSTIASTPLFAADAFSNLTDKLKASSTVVKSDTLSALNECINNFGAKYCLTEYVPLWNAIKFELMRNSEGGDVGLATIIPGNVNINSDVSNYQLAINIVISLARVLSEFDINAFNKFFNYILGELKPNFKYNKDLKQSSTVLSALGSVNAQSFNKVITNSLPLFLQNTSETNQLKLIIMNLSFFFDSYIAVYGSAEKDMLNNTVIESSLTPYKDEILMILGKALTGSSEVEVTLRTLSIVQFTKMIKMKEFLSEEEVSLIVQYLSETILEDKNKNIYYACLEGLKVISDIYEPIVYEISLKRMLSLLPNEINATINLSEGKTIEKELILKIILDYTTSRHCLVKESIYGICEKLYEIAPLENSNNYCFILITALYTLLENNISLIKDEEGKEIKNTIEDRLLSTLINNSSILNDNHNLNLLSIALFFINASSDRSGHQSALEKINDLFIEKYQIFNKHSRLVIPYTKLISGLDKDCKFNNCDKYFESCIILLQKHSDEIVQFNKLGYLELLMVMSNKWLDEKYVSDSLDNLDWSNLSSINLEILTWITKALVIKNSKYSAGPLEKFVNLLENDKVGDFVAKLFEVFVVDIGSYCSKKGISRSNNVKVLYKQKFFNYVFPEIVSKYKLVTDLNIKSNYLTALSMILKHVPNLLLELVIQELVPMLLEALKMQNADVKISSLETLNSVCEKNSVLTTKYFHTLVPLLLKLLKKSNTNNVRVRLLTMQLLQLIALSVPINYSQSMKNNVLTELLDTLDDPKRIIRKKGIDTRQIYFEIGQTPSS
ncbi:hypothetical protein TPHA_0F01360 [Tetrapisispora phaffii CBS 4417]|uniref:MMS19 nucleotide excision repair protein n=1 Tax=Tetrapisispora phaffii (strain ATCC 24235 / CBS 4417 / NBRC 1672 / NRRL Y-8282 / UCD 70-5) TaxID=1071381 RepID=G8BV39_TETPH|nr:hypothetical protein TPHA_0F01360 [Tetrapisispora phaffii CBS 4417]CCE63621.1 hypothetical protein TPHA_0F01360 [Tetrapisispora phaffii CBS 4417]